MNGIEFDLGFFYFQITDRKLRASFAIGYIKIFQGYGLKWNGSLLYFGYSTDEPAKSKFDILYLNLPVRKLIYQAKKWKSTIKLKSSLS